MSPRSRVWLSRLVHYGMCAAAVTWLAFNTDWERFRQVLGMANWRLVLVALLVFGPAPLLISLRIKWLLTVQSIHISVWQAIKVTFAGNFLIFALPVGTGGGDTAKAYYIARDTPHKHEAVMTVFFDRVIGVLGLLLMSGVIVLIDWGNPAFNRWRWVIGLTLLALASGACVYFSTRIRRVLRFDQLVALLPLASHLQRIDRAVLLFRRHPRRLAACMAITVLLHATCVVSYFLAGWALNLVGDMGWHAFPVYLAYTPICLLAGALPIGVMEVTFSQLLAEAAHLGTPEAAISLSFLGRLIQLAWSLPGALVVLQGRPQVRPEPPAAIKPR
ncbi:MAG: flippase-like domain-containing protein [Phycisphaerae bacterium]|nr:flippase-like domain-containing protein [Phycisphaerae bacterium]